MESHDKTRPAGGFATQRGINYQNRVAAYFSACCLAERAALPELLDASIESVRCETGEPLADILLGLENGGLAFIEVKRAIHLNVTQMKPVVSQLIQQLLLSEQGTSGGKFPWRRPLDPHRDRFLLVTSSDSPEVVTKHLAACFSRFGSQVRAEDIASVPQNDAETRTFSEFHALVLQVWKDLIGIEPELEKVTRLYALFRVGVLDVNPGEADEQHDQGLPRGVMYEALEEFQKFANQKLNTGKLHVEVTFLPMRPDQIEAALTEGLGDMIASGIVVTPEREKRVAFSTPIQTDVTQIIVTGKSYPTISTLADLGGKEVYANPLTTYYENLQKANVQLQKANKTPMVIKAADKNLTDDDLVQIVNAGLIPATVTTKQRADLWSQVLKQIQPHPDLVIASGTQLAWVMRKNNPQLKQLVDEFVSSHSV